MKIIRRLRRSKGEQALLEGPHLIEEALRRNIELDSVLASPAFLESDIGRGLCQELERPPLAVDPRLLDEITDSDSPRGIVGLARLPHFEMAQLPVRKNGVYVYGEGLQDPGNLGALVRSAEASGAAGLCLGPDSVHPNHPRALRASAGSLLRFPVVLRGSAESLADHLRAVTPRWIALMPAGGESLWSTRLTGSLVLAVGAEGPGLSEEIQSRADIRWTIPLESGVESLNATVAASLALFELRRQRIAGS